MLNRLIDSFRDLMPIVLVIAIFQLLVLRQPLPDAMSLLTGLLAVVVGLAMFVHGLELGLFPLGQSLAQSFARKGSITWLLIFAFALGFGTAIAEPALLVVANEAAAAAALGGAVENSPEALKAYADALRYTVAVAVGLALVVGVTRIVTGLPLHYMIMGGYLLVVLVTTIAPEPIIGIAFDAGGVTTSTITVPLVAALGVGLASSLEGRNPVTDGFGLIAFAALSPIIGVMLFGLFWW